MNGDLRDLAEQVFATEHGVGGDAGGDACGADAEWGWIRGVVPRAVLSARGNRRRWRRRL